MEEKVVGNRLNVGTKSLNVGTKALKLEQWRTSVEIELFKMQSTAKRSSGSVGSRVFSGSLSMMFVVPGYWL